MKRKVGKENMDIIIDDTIKYNGNEKVYEDEIIDWEKYLKEKKTKKEEVV